MLRTSRLRVTRPRVAVLEALARSGHLDADGVRRHVVADAAHRVGAGGLRRAQRPGPAPAGAADRARWHVRAYELRTGDNHHHLICRQCGQIRDVDCAVGAAPCLTADDDGGFDVDEAEVTYWGTCPDCQRRRLADARRPDRRRVRRSFTEEEAAAIRGENPRLPHRGPLQGDRRGRAPDLDGQGPGDALRGRCVRTGSTRSTSPRCGRTATTPRSRSAS